MRFFKSILFISVVVLSGCSGNIYEKEITQALERCQNNGGVHRIWVEAFPGESNISCVNGAKFKLVKER